MFQSKIEFSNQLFSFYSVVGAVLHVPLSLCVSFRVSFWSLLLFLIAGLCIAAYFAHSPHTDFSYLCVCLFEFFILHLCSGGFSLKIVLFRTRIPNAAETFLNASHMLAIFENAVQVRLRTVLETLIISVATSEIVVLLSFCYVWYLCSERSVVRLYRLFFGSSWLTSHCSNHTDSRGIMEEYMRIGDARLSRTIT